MASILPSVAERAPAREASAEPGWVSDPRGRIPHVSHPARATLAKRRSDVARMFDAVAERYDTTNDVLSLGLDRRWRRAVVAAVHPLPGERVLDLAAGTGTSSRPFADAGATVVPADLSLGMLRVGKHRQPDLSFVAADALSLPFADGAFDAVTISFGLRNVEHTEDALRELRRVTRRGGRVVVCEFSAPTLPGVRRLYRDVLLAGLPGVARVVSSNPPAYEYLAESIRAWPAQQELAALMGRAGWRRVQWRDLTGGVVALHRGVA